MKYIVIEDAQNALRERRVEECFSVINRGKLWYDTLTIDELSELRSWYRKWLDVTETMLIPEPPAWLHSKIKEEEILF
jgi:hypothetical protein